jgi:hypothetical protein
MGKNTHSPDNGVPICVICSHELGSIRDVCPCHGQLQQPHTCTLSGRPAAWTQVRPDRSNSRNHNRPRRLSPR